MSDQSYSATELLNEGKPAPQRGIEVPFYGLFRSQSLSSDLWPWSPRW
jgi:hypothetical protein